MWFYIVIIWIVRAIPYPFFFFHISLIQHKNFQKLSSFFLSTIIEWNKLDHNIKNSTFDIFRKSILTFIRWSANSFFSSHNAKGIKFITKLRHGLSYLREYKFRHSFQDSLEPLGSCGLDIESTSHFLLHCPTYINERRTLLSTIENIDNNLLDLYEAVLIKILLVGSNSFDTNTNVLNATIDHISSIKRSDELLFQWKQEIFKQGYDLVNSVFIAVVSCIISNFLFLFS